MTMHQRIGEDRPLIWTTKQRTARFYEPRRGYTYRSKGGLRAADFAVCATEAAGGGRYNLDAEIARGAA